MSALLLAALAIVSVVAPVPAAAQAAVDVPPDDPVYSTLARLRGHGLLTEELVGFRPWSRARIARIVDRAREALAERPEAGTAGENAVRTYLEGLLAELAASHGGQPWKENRLGLLDEVHAEALWLDSPGRPAPATGLGHIDARVNPLVQYRGGREYAHGATLALETVHSVRVGERFAFEVRPRFQAGFPRAGARDADGVSLRHLQARLKLGRVDVSMGRSPLLSGPALEGGGLGSTNPRGLDRIEVSSAEPSRLPWLLGYLGPARWLVSVGRTGAHRDVPHGFLVQYRLGTLPTPWLEWGVQVLIQSGGEGAPESPLGERIVDHLVIPDLFMTDDDIRSSNKLVGLDLRMSFPELRGVELWWDGVLDDFDLRRLGSSLDHNAQHVLGFALSRLDGAGRLRLAAELHHVGVTVYRHGQFTSGLTLDRAVYGNALGPNARGAYLTLDWDVDRRNDLVLKGAWEQRSADDWVSFPEPDFHYEKAADFPEEDRWRVLATWRWGGLTDPFALEVEGGWERATGWGFVEGRSRDNGLGRVGVEWRLGRGG